MLERCRSGLKANVFACNGLPTLFFRAEGSHSGRVRSLGKRVYRKVSQVRILYPPLCIIKGNPEFCREQNNWQKCSRFVYNLEPAGEQILVTNRNPALSGRKSVYPKWVKANSLALTGNLASHAKHVRA